MEIEDTTNLTDVADTVVTGDATGIEDSGVEEAKIDDGLSFDDDGNQIPGPSEDEEIEIDPEFKLKLPKDQAEKLRLATMRQADYTRKTQEVAERARNFEAERVNVQQMDEQEIVAVARLNAMSQRYNQLSAIDYNGETRRIDFQIEQARNQFDDELANRLQAERSNLDALFKEFTQLTPQHQNLSSALAQHRNQRQFQEQQKSAKLMEEGRADLAKHVPGWGDDLKAKLVNYAATFGFDASELADLEADPRAARILHAAFQGAGILSKTQAAERATAGQKTTPVAPLKGTSARTPVRADTNDFAAFERLADTKLKKIKA